MERTGSAALATFFMTEAVLEPRAQVALGESVARHLRARRLGTGTTVALVDGAGRRGTATIVREARDSVTVEIGDVEEVPSLPEVHLMVPVADRDRMLWLAEKATELGVTSWRAVRFRRSQSVSPRGEGPAFAAKLRSRMVSALEQSGGAWLPEMVGDVDVESLSAERNTLSIVLDAAGPPMVDALDHASRRVASMILVGPEGGIERAELGALTNGGWRVASLGENTLRFETAAMAAIAVMRAAFQRD